MRLGACRVELGTASGLEPRLCQLQRRALVFHVAPGDRKSRLLATQLEVGPCDFRGNRYLCIPQPGFRALRFGSARLDVAAHPAEEVELPEGVETGVVETLGE